MGWTPTPEQREALIRAHALAGQLRDSGVSWTAIARRFTAEAYPTMNGGPWTYQMVQRLLKNPVPVKRPTKYATRHWRVADRRGPAKLLKCVDCAANGIDKQARDWSHRHGTDPEDVMNYDPRCRKCHIAYDGSGHRKPHTEEARAKMSVGQRRRYGTEDMPRAKPAKGEPRYSEGQRRAYAEGTRVGANPFQSGKTHCPQNHEYDEENTYVDKRGQRSCKKCMRERTRQWRAAQKAKRQPPDAA